MKTGSMKTKHTEGEWVIEPFQVGVSNGWMNIRLPENNFATMYCGKYMDALNPNDEIIREVEANSKLIAEAPDLLHAAIFFLENFEKDDPQGMTGEAIFHNLNDAVKKATL